MTEVTKTMSETETKIQQMRDLFFKDMNIPHESFDYLTRNISGEKSLEENFSVVWGLRELHEVITPFIIESPKSENEAARFRTQGNDFYKKMNLKEAFEKYNLCIMNAPHPAIYRESETNVESPHNADHFVHPRIDPDRYGGWNDELFPSLAMGYANRSAVLYELELYNECMHDIHLAFIHGYPEETRRKLDQRREKCEAALKKKSSAIMISKSQLSSNNVALKKALSSSTKEEPPALMDPNPNVPAHSLAIKISESPFGGRGLVATRNIRPGEVLAVDRAYSVTLREKSIATHCSMCMRLSPNPLPCPGCAKVMFCSESCRDKGLTEDHWLECSILPAMYALQLNNHSIMSLKMLKSFSFNHMKEMLNRLQMEKQDSVNNAGYNEQGIYDSTSYQTIYHLCSNYENHPFLELLWHCMTAFVMTKLLEHSKRYFVNEQGEAVSPTEDDLQQTGALLLNHIMKAKINSFQHGHIEDCIGLCLFPAVSLINHSCNPSVGYYMIGREIVLRALRPISCDEELTIAYTYTFVDKEKEFRSKVTQKGFFQCCCEACEGNWPTLTNLPEIKVKCFLCFQPQQEMNHICSDCKAQGRDSKPTLEVLRRIEEATGRSHKLHVKQTNNDTLTKEDYHQLLEDIELMYKYFYMPCRMFNNLRINLENCFGAGL